MNNNRVDTDFIPFILMTNYRAIKFIEKYYGNNKSGNKITGDRKRNRTTPDTHKNK